MVRHLLRQRIARRLADVILHLLNIDHAAPTRIQSHFCLQEQQPPHTRIDLRPRDLTQLHCPQQTVVGPIEIRWKLQQILPCFYRIHRRSACRIPVSRRIQLRQSMHLHRIGNDYPFEREALPQQPRHHLVRDCRNLVRIRLQCWKRHVRNHHRIRSRLDARRKRRQLHRIQPLGRCIHPRHLQVRIRVRIAMPGKVFQRRQHPTLMRPAYVRGHHRRHRRRVLPKGSRVDNRVLRIDLHIRDRIKVPSNPQRPRLLRDNLRPLLDIRRIARRSERHRVRKIFHRAQPHPRPALKVH